MASTYTTSLKIQQIANGEQAGTWGSTTNTNWNLIEQAVSGVQTITMSNANYTLSSLNGTLDQARNAVLVIQGTNSGVYQIIAPLVTKTYIVSNQTTGGYSITVGGASGSVITIPTGIATIVYCDGTNFYSGISGLTGNQTITGNLTVSGNETVSGTLGVTGAQTNSSTLQATTITATTQFSGPGTGLTGTASSLTVGNATNAVNATNPSGGGSFITSLNIGSQSVSYAATSGNGGVTSFNGSTGAVTGYVSGVGGQVFTSSGTFTIPTGVTAIKVTVIGGGANGNAGGTAPGGGPVGSGGDGGQGGAAAISYLTSLTPGNTIAVTVGAVAGQSKIASGTQTITTVTANGNGGSATGGAINISGQVSGPATSGGGTAGGAGGIGANSILGSGGAAGAGGDGTGGVAGSASSGYGSGGGGGGGGGYPTYGGGSGGAGKQGVVIFEW